MAQEEINPWILTAAAVFHPLAALLAKRVNTGLERIPASGGAILVLNHVSHLDPLYDSVLVHRLGRMPHFLAKHSLFRPALLRRVMVGTGQIPVTRNSTNAQESLRAANAALAAGKVILIYPEGTITRDPQDWPMRAHTGVARLALANDVPVIPIARWGTRQMVDVYQKKFHLWPRGLVTTAVGEPLDLSAYRAKPVSNELVRKVTDVIMFRVTTLLAEIRGETPPAEPFRGGGKIAKREAD